MKIISVCNKVIEYGFYALFLLVPLAFTSDNFELFEFSKMWFVFAITIVIAGSWTAKCVLQRRILIQRTLLDIPILLFLASQIISTIFSFDTHVSVWGYYSRWNGGLLSIISYIFLYYAFLSNLSDLSNLGHLMVKRLLKISLVSGLIVTLWGLPSHFGYDPTCLIFRGTFDVSCWTNDFMPKVRIFSTLGQPGWLAAYLAILIPLSIVMFINNIKSQTKPEDKFSINLFAICYLLFAILFYLALLYTGARSGFLAVWSALIFFFAAYLWLQKEQLKKTSPKKILLRYWYLFVVFVVFLIVTFFVGTTFSQFDKFTFSGLKNQVLQSKKITQTINSQDKSLGGTSSVEIRKIVWKGAIDLWRHYPIFGTGVETFAFSYYRYRPIEHNLTSEWDFLYNKAHNEYLNYLATTGFVGLGTYLLMIGWFLFLCVKNLKNQNYTLHPIRYTLITGLLAGYISILVSNFFGFSVVVVNLYLFLIPAFVFVLQGLIDPQKTLAFGWQGTSNKKQEKFFSKETIMISVLLLFAFYLLLNLVRFWFADKDYALGYNLNKAGEYQDAYPKLQSAVIQRGDEPTFKDEFSINEAVLAAALFRQGEKQTGQDAKDSKETAGILTQQAISISDQLKNDYPNNTVFAKTRVRVFYTLSQIDSKYLTEALNSIIRVSKIAPTDAKVSYNLGLLYGQAGDTKKAIQTLENTIKLKPDYRDAYYGLALFYHEAAIDKNGRMIDSAMQQKAVETMNYLVKNFDDSDAKSALKSWGEM